MPSYQTDAQGSAWNDVKEPLRHMLEQIEQTPGKALDLARFAAQYAIFAKAYHAALTHEGLASMRAAAAAKALDLRTAKSHLLEFLDAGAQDERA